MHLDWTTIAGTIIATWPPVVAGFVINSRRTRAQLGQATRKQNEQIAEMTRQQTEQIAGIADQQTLTLLAGAGPAPESGQQPAG